MSRIAAAFAAYTFIAACCAAQGSLSGDPADETLEDLGLSTPLDRDELVQAVLDRNPEIEAARRAWQADLQQVPQAGSLEDPTASVAVAPLSIGASDARFGSVLRLGQELPFPGTLRLRAAAAEATATTARYRIEETRLRLATTAALLYNDNWLVDRALAITREHIDLLATFQRIATDRYAAGTAPQQAPIRAEVEAARLLHRQVGLFTERRRVSARLNALLHRPATAPLPPAPEQLAAEAADEVAVATAAVSRPAVDAQRAEIESLRHRVALEKLRLAPDFEVTTSYTSTWDAPEHRWTAGVGLRLPVWRKRLHASVAAAEARLAAGESELAALSDAVAAEVEIALAAAQEAGHVERLYRNRVVPAARDQVAAARAGFETGEGTMLGLIDAQRTLLTAELSLEEAIAKRSKARAELHRVSGRMPWTSKSARGERQKP
jgi:outer membrane protein TolC